MRKLNVMLTPLVMLGCLAITQPTHAASFDCAKAQTKVEKLICADAELSKLDEELNTAYKAAVQVKQQADTVKQAQKLWMKERNGCADAACVKGAYETRLSLLAAARASSGGGTTAKPKATTPDKPGFFRLDKSTNDEVCSTLGRIINDDIQEYGETQFEKHDEFVKWNVVDEKNIERGAPRRYSESVERADADINNDGVVDQVIRTKWSVRGVLDDELGVLPLNQQRVVIDELISSGNTITFTSHYWIDRHQKKYSNHLLEGWEWYFDGVAAINLFQQNGVTYVVAHDYATPKNYSAKVYVFQLDKEYKKYEEKDVCMFERICPCGGCDDMRGNQTAKTLPAKKWCHK